MHPCPTCACHVRLADSECPHCGARVESRRSHSVAAMVLSLTLAGCVGGTGTTKVDPTGDTGDIGQTTFEPPYGISVLPTGDTGTTDSGTGTGDTGATSETGDTGATSR